MPFLKDHRVRLDIKIVIATHASVREEKEVVGIASSVLDWSFSIRLPNFKPIYQAEFLAILLALRKLPQSITDAIILSDCLSVCSLTAPKMSNALKVFYDLARTRLRLIRFVWIPGNKGLTRNEYADALAVASQNYPIISILPTLAFIAVARFKKFVISDQFEKSRLATSNFSRLK